MRTTSGKAVLGVRDGMTFARATIRQALLGAGMK